MKPQIPTTRWTTRWPAKETIIAAAVALALAASLPLLGIALFMLRPLLLTLLAIVLLAVISPWVLVPRTRGRWTADVAPEEAYRGLRLARDVVLHPGHSWAWFDEETIVGADDIAQAAIGPIDEVTLPSPGSHVRRGQTLFTLRHGDRRLNIPSPISGTVTRTNDTLARCPELVNSRPFSLGWIARLHAEEPEEDRAHLLRGHKARAWFHHQVDRVLRDQPADSAPAPLDEHAWRQLERECAATA
ncbi:MAG: glycine cleavage system protein H [Phycisphaerales bacterium]|nr:glycine cleavage system protein H [Phycisphaerales bacterium]